MSSIRAPLINGAPIVKVLIRQQLSVPQACSAFIDTGAKECFVQVGLPVMWGFTPFGNINLSPSYDIEFGISEDGMNYSWFPVKLGEWPNFPFAQLGCEIAVGQSFLKNCRFVYDGPKGEYSIDW